MDLRPEWTQIFLPKCRVALGEGNAFHSAPLLGTVEFEAALSLLIFSFLAKFSEVAFVSTK